MNKKIQKILIANRSEIALRIQATCHALEMHTIAIYAPEDRMLSYVYKATESYPLSLHGHAAYLNQEEIIDIALNAHADAIHPGYGFLAENSEFAQKVIDAGLLWVGPNPHCMKLLANKSEAKKLMQKYGVPVVPGETYNIDKDNSLQQAKLLAAKIQYPIILKCALGGGGKAMRLVKKNDEFESAWHAVASESKKFFNSNEILVEKYLTHSRHVEVQIIGNGTEFIHVYERECSIQRKNQKIIEETPCLFISSTIKQKLYKSALTVARSVAYDNVGTVEFLVTLDEQYFFIEMNTRLQVEHSVTEMTTGRDLVEAQLYITQTKKLPYKQTELSQAGHAIECRIYAEDPAHNFYPSTGEILQIQLPFLPFSRIDHDLEEGGIISPFLIL